MNSKLCKPSAWRGPLVLATTSCLAACSPTTTTLTAATDMRVAAGVCEVWRPQTYSSRDDEQTQLEARANNAARAAYCITD